MLEPCARCGARAAEEGSVLCAICGEQGGLSPAEAERVRLRKLEDDPYYELVPGEHYDFRTTDGTVYHDAVFVEKTDGGILIEAFDGLVRVGISDAEFQEAT
jgi:hypothetical protein